LVLETLCVSNYGGIAWFSFGKKGGKWLARGSDSLKKGY